MFLKVDGKSSPAQNVVAGSAFFMLRLRYVMVPAMKAAFTEAAGAFTGKQDPLPWGSHKWEGRAYETDAWGDEFCYMLEHDRNLHGAGSRRWRAKLC